MKVLYRREKLEQLEHGGMAAWAQKSADSIGRKYKEPPHPFRTCYQRDRARIIHCKAFRRLEYKTQVFLNGAGDHLRTRLTHTMEVASVSRTIASALGLNQDLAEAVALAHDLGHAPSGHAGEHTLNRLMSEDGGFEHNRQSLRVVELLESRYPEFPGLNLSYEVLEGLRKHEEGYLRPASGETKAETFPQPSLEAQVADLADEITYYSHDLDDGLDSGLIDAEQLENLALWQCCRDRVHQWFPKLTGPKLHQYVVRVLIDYQVEELVKETARNVENLLPGSADDVRRNSLMLAQYPEKLSGMNRELRGFLFHHLYDHNTVAGPNNIACQKIEAVFRYYEKSPDELRERLQNSVDPEPSRRRLCDYIAGMTDRYLAREYEKLCG